jgi:hypothetical protein
MVELMQADDSDLFAGAEGIGQGLQMGGGLKAFAQLAGDPGR